MNMEDVKQLMKEVGWGFLGTTYGKTVGVRPMGGWAWMEDELWCASMKSTDKISQLQAVIYKLSVPFQLKWDSYSLETFDDFDFRLACFF